MQTTAQTNDSGHVAGGKTEADTSVHTALPWHVTDSIHNGKVYISKEGSERGSVALCEREEDAAFIVRACNAHDDLVKALNEVAACFEAAYIEGLAEVLAETSDERLKDLVLRRLTFANDAAVAALAKAGINN